GDVVPDLGHLEVQLEVRQAHLEERAAVGRRLKVQVLEQPGERVALAGVGIEQRLADRKKELPEGRLPVDVADDGNDVLWVRGLVLRLQSWAANHDRRSLSVAVEAGDERRRQGGVLQEGLAGCKLNQLVKRLAVDLERRRGVTLAAVAGVGPAVIRTRAGRARVTRDLPVQVLALFGQRIAAAGGFGGRTHRSSLQARCSSGPSEIELQGAQRAPEKLGGAFQHRQGDVAQRYLRVHGGRAEDLEQNLAQLLHALWCPCVAPGQELQPPPVFASLHSQDQLQLTVVRHGKAL